MSTDAAELEALPPLAGVGHSLVTLPDGLRLHVALAGDPAADPVLLLHGFPQHWWEWRKVVPALAGRYRVIAPDLRGSGWSDAPRGGYGTTQLAGDVLGLLDSLGIERVHLVAHDFAALLGYRLCFEHPERVRAFVCLGPHPYVRFDPHLLAAVADLWFQPVVATPGLGAAALRGQRLPRYLLRHFLVEQGSITPHDERLFTERLRAPGHPEAASALYRHLILPEIARLSTGAYRGKRLTVPTSALFGAEERGVRPGLMDVHGDVADDLRGELVPGAGHYIADERADVVVDRALELFART